jgi:SAM-dependent methyltransferase
VTAPEQAWALRLFDRSILKHAKYHAIVEMLGDTRGKDCLDLGSDNGVISYLLRGGGGRWSSADLTEESVASIRSLVGSDVYRIEGERMPFADAAFDRVVVVDLLEHVADDARCMAELHRILRAGGELVVNTPHAKRWSLMRPLRNLLGLTDAWHGHVRPGYTPATIAALLGARFQLDRVSTYSKVFSEALDVALNFAFQRSRRPSGEDRSKGTVVMAADIEKRARQFRVLGRVYPLLKLWAKLDLLCVGAQGYYLVVRARKL